MKKKKKTRITLSSKESRRGEKEARITLSSKKLKKKEKNKNYF